MERSRRSFTRDGVLPAEDSNGTASGRLDSRFEVTPEGAATLEIGLWVPPGRAGMQPTIALSYDSQRGNDLLGVGWTVTGASAITRCRRDHFHDGFSEPVGFTAADALTLDGQRL